MNKSLIEVQAGYDDQEDDLTWLARNVHEWWNDAWFIVKSEGHGLMYRLREVPDKYCGFTFTKDQWQKRRSELQNKPSWDNAPCWAEYLAQDSDGEWFWYEKEPEKLSSKCSMWNGNQTRSQCNYQLESTGEVLGDWRNTLEKRPERRELNPPTSRMHHTQAVEIAKETGMCSDGELCGNRIDHPDGGSGYCADCPNHSEQPLDMVNRPPHYQSDNGIECIEAIKAQLTPEEFRGYCKGNTVKYVWRERQKGGNESIRKAEWYLKQITEQGND